MTNINNDIYVTPTKICPYYVLVQSKLGTRNFKQTAMLLFKLCLSSQFKDAISKQQHRALNANLQNKNKQKRRK